MFTCNGQQFATIEIARKVAVEGWTHVPAAGPDAHGNTTGGCNWLVERAGFVGGDDEWPAEWMEWTADCGAEAAYNDDRFVCANGHEHTSAQARDREGWDYCEDEWDAAVVARAGKTVVPMTPNTHIDEREAARIMVTL